jgi:phosphate transport system protein
MGDLAVNIAERALFLADHAPLPIPVELREMVRQTSTMVRESLDSLVNQDAGLARQVCRADDIVDDLNREMFRILEEAIRGNPETVQAEMNLLSVSRALERIADAATNIAEDIVFMVEGQVIKHRSGDYRGVSREPSR